MPKQPKPFFFAAMPLFIILLLDGMGLGLVIPVITALLEPKNHFLTSEFALHYHNFIYGSVFGIFMLCWFLGAVVLGDLSDHIGRKKSLMVCLIGAFLGYGLCAIAVSAKSLFLLYLGRVISGLTSGSQPIAQAAIIDLSEPQHKIRNMGYIFLSMSLGFIFGPLLGGVLSNPNIVSWFHYSTPFYFAAFLAVLNILLLYKLFCETFVSFKRYDFQVLGAWKLFISAFKHPKISYLSVTYLIYILGWSSYFSFIPIFLTKNFHFTDNQISLYLALMGVGFGLGNGYLANYLSRFFSSKTNAILFILIAAFLVLIMLLAEKTIYFWIFVALIGICVSIFFANIITIFSDQVSPDEQGWVMGVTGSIMALTWGLVSIFLGFVAVWSVALPLVITVLSFFMTSVMLAKMSLSKGQELPN